MVACFLLSFSVSRFYLKNISLYFDVTWKDFSFHRNGHVVKNIFIQLSEANQSSLLPRHTPILRKKSLEVIEIIEEVRPLVVDMICVMKKYNGRGFTVNT